MNVPVVVPDWVKGCEREGRIVGVRGYYLNADPKLRQVGPGMQSQGSQPSQTSLPTREVQPQEERSQQPLRVQPPLPSPRIEHTPPTPEQARRSQFHSNGVSSEEPPTPPPKPDAPAPIETTAAVEPEVAPIAEEPAVEEEQEQETANGAVPEAAAEEKTQEPEPEPENNLKTIGIPHEPLAEKEAPATEEGFDEVDL